MKKFSILLLVVLLGLSLVIVGCGGANNNNEDPNNENENENVDNSEDEEEVGSFEGRIVGIDAGAGIMEATEKAIDEYGLELDLITSSDAAMTAELKTAYENEEWIVVTGWAPHWKFAEFDLKFLEDPKGVYGGEETINAITRLGFADDAPEINQLLTDFYESPAELGNLIGMMEEYDDNDEAAKVWIEENRDLVDGWLENVGEPSVEEVTIGYVQWACANANTHMMKNLLEDEFGIDVTITDMEAGIMWQSVASGDIDFMITAWLPGTHATYIEEYGDDVVDLGPLYDGAAIGLVVPEYVTIDSIEELNDHQ